MDYLKTIHEQVDAILTGIVRSLPLLGIAVAIVLVTYVLARFAARFADKATAHLHMREALKQLIETLVRLGIWLVGIMVAATVVVPGLTPASLFAGLGVGALAIGFAFQDIFQNFLAGVLIMLRDKMRIGDQIESDKIAGKVEKITLRETHVRQPSNELIIVPNSVLFKNPVKVLTDKDVRRVDVAVGVSTQADLDQATALIRKAVEAGQHRLADKPVDVLATDFAGERIALVARFWCDTREAVIPKAKDEAIHAIKRALDDAGIKTA